MSIAHGTARASAPKSQYDEPNATSAEHGSAVAEADPYALDHLRFRIEMKKGRHYFHNVRFGEGAHAIAGFLEGRALEDLTPVLLRSSFAHSPILPRLQHLVRDLQRVFCE